VFGKVDTFWTYHHHNIVSTTPLADRLHLRITTITASTASNFHPHSFFLF
jgi:hypothetical protein